MSLKDSWKETGTSLGNAFRDLGKTLVKTVKKGADMIDEWANTDENAPKPDSNEDKKSEPDTENK